MGLLNYTTAKINELLAKVAALPAKVMDGDTKIPAKTSDLENDSKFVRENGLKTVNGHSLLGTGDLTISGGPGGGVADSVDWSKVLNKPGWVNSQTKPSYTASEVGALPSDTSIPAKTSELENDSKFVKEAGLKTINGQSIVGTGNINISGGSGGGGEGNVNVTNAAELKTFRDYVFKPAAEGSTEGTFSPLNIATQNEDGLMSTQMVEKLGKIKDVYNFPAAVLDLTSASTSDEILTAFGLDPALENENLAYMTFIIASGQSGDYEISIPMIFIGNHECNVYAIGDPNTIELELSYISQGGKMRTIKVSATEGTDVYTYAVSISESGDDTYYLPSAVFTLSDNSTPDEIKEALGGKDGIDDLEKAIASRKDVIIEKRVGSNMFYSPVRFYSINNSLLLFLEFDKANNTGMETVRISKLLSSYGIQIIYHGGYSLNSSLLKLTSDSISDDVSVAVGGESGLKKIIRTVKNGNLLLLRGETAGGYLFVCLSCSFEEKDNGDINIAFSGQAYGLWGGLYNSICMIVYEKESNTFSCHIMNAK